MFLFVLLCCCRIENLTLEDLKSEDRILIYVYYERPNYKCPTCFMYEDELKKVINISIKKINFYENTQLAARLCNVFFPAFIIYDHKRLHHIELMSGLEIMEVFSKNAYSHTNCAKWYNNPSNVVLIIHSYAIHIFLSTLGNFYIVLDKVPSFVTSIVIGFLIASIIYIFIVTVMDCFSSSDISKEKND